MAEIPIEKKSSMGWLWALLALVLAALLVWWLVTAGDDDDADLVANQDDAAVVSDAGTATTGTMAAGGLMDAQSVEEANRRSLARIQADPNATPRMFFQFDSAELTSGAEAVLDAAIEAQPNARTEGITLAGFADRVGSEPYNRELSEQRAEQVRQYLVSQGMTADQIDVEAEGETPTLAETGDGEREPLNRRVRLEFGDSE